ncbi:TIGR04282 family arsenosugar biosynthesis glycosyltransferase [Polaromonas sp. YR568]|uniref:TIGR04282 family arsenosugar biosynthesis glycosyltransferase n=1 Tax=Polaromonas sp. YR568 TaxID=1855301 RepID=UPI003137BE59
MKAARIVIMAKAPIAGFCKTRLIPALGEHGAAALAHRMLLRAVHFALAARLGTVELCVTPGPQYFDWTTLDLPQGLVCTDQGEGDLGARMGRVARRVTQGGEAILLMGTDCPTLETHLLQRAEAALQDHDASLVPATDGGYVLLGLNHFDATLFDAMPWSTAAVAAETRQRVAQLGWLLCELLALHDIDEPQDLAWLPADLQTGSPASLPLPTPS